MSAELLDQLRNHTDALQAELDIYKRRNLELVKSMTYCARRNELGEDCRVWLVMNGLLKTKRRSKAELVIAYSLS